MLQETKRHTAKDYLMLMLPNNQWSLGSLLADTGTEKVDPHSALGRVNALHALDRLRACVAVCRKDNLNTLCKRLSFRLCLNFHT